MKDEEKIQQDDELNEDRLINYLKGNLSQKENHEMEKSMMDSDFVNDAVEGLQTFSDDKKVQEYAEDLNKKLQQQLKIKKRRKEKRQIKGMEWVVFAAIIILGICATAYFIIMMMKKP